MLEKSLHRGKSGVALLISSFQLSEAFFESGIFVALLLHFPSQFLRGRDVQHGDGFVVDAAEVIDLAAVDEDFLAFGLEVGALLGNCFCEGKIG